MFKYHIVRLKHKHTLQQTQHTGHVLPLAPGRRMLVQTSVEAEMWLNTAANAQSTNSPIIVQSSLTTEEDPELFFLDVQVVASAEVMTI